MVLQKKYSGEGEGNEGCTHPSCKTVGLQVAHHVRDDDSTNHIINFRMSLRYPGQLPAST